MAREPFIAWRNRRDPDGLQPYCRDTGRNGTLVGATGFSIARRWFFGLMTFRLDEQPRNAMTLFPETIMNRESDIVIKRAIAGEQLLLGGIRAEYVSHDDESITALIDCPNIPTSRYPVTASRQRFSIEEIAGNPEDDFAIKDLA